MRYLILTFTLSLCTFLLSAQTVEVKYYEPGAVSIDGKTVQKKATYTLKTTTGRSLFLEHPTAEDIKKDYKNMNFDLDFGSPVELWLYKDFKTKELSYKVALRKGKFLKAEDQIVPIQWQLTNQQRTISGIPCQEAIGNFRGRTYHAWFTYTIPISDGPWKLNGLPGLILEVYDDEKFVVFLFDGLKKTNEPIVKPREKLKAVDHKVAYDKVFKAFEKMALFAVARMKKEGYKIALTSLEPSTREVFN